MASEQKKTRVLTVRVTQDMVDALTLLAEGTPGVSASDWVRRFIEEGLINHDSSPTTTALVVANMIERERRINDKIRAAIDTAAVEYLASKDKKQLEAIRVLRQKVPHAVILPEIEKALMDLENDSKEGASD